MFKQYKKKYKEIAERLTISFKFPGVYIISPKLVV